MFQYTLHIFSRKYVYYTLLTLSKQLTQNVKMDVLFIKNCTRHVHFVHLYMYV